MADISRLPGPIADTWEWQFQGACRGIDPEAFFHPEGERGPSRVNRETRAKAVCATWVKTRNNGRYKFMVGCLSNRATMLKAWHWLDHQDFRGLGRSGWGRAQRRQRCIEAADGHFSHAISRGWHGKGEQRGEKKCLAARTHDARD